jgi:predicted dehydrogenase
MGMEDKKSKGTNHLLWHGKPLPCIVRAAVYEKGLTAGIGIDGCFDLTPLVVTEEVASRIMRLGVPMVVEKPPGKTVEQARRLVGLAKELNAPHMVSFNRRFGPAFTKARQWLAQNGRRAPMMVAARMLRHERHDEDFASTSIHSIDHVLAFMGRPLECNRCLG